MSDREFVQRHQGKYPVIYLDFSTLENDEEEIKEGISQQIQNLFQSNHEHFLKAFKEEEKASGNVLMGTWRTNSLNQFSFIGVPPNYSGWLKGRLGHLGNLG